MSLEQDTLGELRSAATLADPEGGVNDILGISVLCQELWGYFPGMKALLGNTLHMGDMNRASTSPLKDAKLRVSVA